MLVGEKIKYLRVGQNLTQKTLANNTGLSITDINRLEHGYIVKKQHEKIKKIAKALDTTVEYLSLNSGEVTSMERERYDLQRIGEFIRDARISQGISQPVMSRKLDITSAQMSRIETGELDIRKVKYSAIKDRVVNLFPGVQELIDNIEYDNSQPEKMDDDSKIKLSIIDRNNEDSGIIGPSSDPGLSEAILFTKRDYFSDIAVDKERNIIDKALGDVEKVYDDNLGKKIDEEKIQSIDKLPDPAITKAAKIASENIRLILFDHIHNELMYYITNKKQISQEHKDIIEAEINEYKSLAFDDILSIKLSRIPVKHEDSTK